jgi:hypothetical protein
MEIPEPLQLEICKLFRDRGLLKEHQILRLSADIEDPDNPRKPSNDRILAEKLRGLVSERTANILEDHGIYFVGQVCRLQRSYVLSRMTKVGPKIFKELARVLRSRSLEFGYTGSEGPFERAALTTIGK